MAREKHVKSARPSARKHALPRSFEGWEEAAKKSLNPDAFEFLHSGAGEGLTARANAESFYRWRLVPHVLRDVSRRDLETTVCGTKLPAAFMVAPWGAQRRVHPEGEMASARAAASTNTPLVLSSGLTSGLEAVSEAMGDVPHWFQIETIADLEVMASVLKRAKKAGYSAIALLVDVPKQYPRYGFRKYDFRLDKGARPGEPYLSDPVFQAKAKRLDRDQGEVELWKRIARNPGFTWKHVEFVREQTHLPLILKGVLHPEDARLALENKVDGIIVSNHGGRRLDGEIASLDALAAISDVTSRKIPLILDSGVRSGADVLKALALGADAVLIGHLFAYALAVAGEEGVPGRPS